MILISKLPLLFLNERDTTCNKLETKQIARLTLLYWEPYIALLPFRRWFRVRDTKKSYKKNFCKQMAELILPLKQNTESCYFPVSIYSFKKLSYSDRAKRDSCHKGNKTLQWRFKHEHKGLQVCYTKEISAFPDLIHTWECITENSNLLRYS